MNYDDMSDLEINKAVAEKMGFITIGSLKDSSVIFVGKSNNGVFKEFDPCNNWSDIGHIIECNKISLIEPDELTNEEWGAGQVYDAVAWASNKNPKRAAAICFLMMRKQK